MCNDRISLLSFLFLALVASPPEATPAAANGLLLRESWAIQSSAEVHETGAAISTPGFKARDWYRATVPTTVFNALVQEHCYPDPYVGMNLRAVPGTTYPIYGNFTDIPMPPGSPFRHSWWYRTEFQLPTEFRGTTMWLGFDGVTYRANVWMNGRQIASADKLAGTWRRFEFDITAAARPGEINSLAVEVFPPQPHDPPLPWWTGLPCHPTRRWAYGATCTSRLLAPSLCATLRCSRSSTCPRPNWLNSRSGQS